MSSRAAIWWVTTLRDGQARETSGQGPRMEKQKGRGVANVAEKSVVGPVKGKPQQHPFRRAVLRGMGIVTPPLLTIVLFIWAWATIDTYMLKPVETSIGGLLMFVHMKSDVREAVPDDASPSNIYVVDRYGVRVPPEEMLAKCGSLKNVLAAAPIWGWRVQSLVYNNKLYVPTADEKWIPAEVRQAVAESPAHVVLASATAREYYDRYVHIRWLPRWRVIPVFLIVFITCLFLLGKFLTAGLGRILWTAIEALVNRVPIVRNVYSAVKQVTDFVFSEREIPYTRVVAFEYPRRGTWSIGFVTGESMLDIRSAANEPVLSVLVPASPVPATGFTITVRKSETIDLSISIDQAVQFVVSCGVVVPSDQLQHEMSSELSTSIARRLEASATPHADAEDRRTGNGRTAEERPGPAADAAESAGGA